MTGLSLLLQGVLACVLCAIAALSLQLIVLGYFRLFRERPRVRLPLLPDEALPRVLVQLPVCDEGPLAVRVAAAAARLDWPADKLEIQVLDDGRRGDPAELVRNVAAVVPQGVNLKVLRRNDRSGFKAGNLAFGLTQSDAPYVAIFDADFVPPTDFLRRMVPALVADSGLSYVQARWGHANRTKNWLTRAQGVLLDAHFAVEQEGRFRAGLPMSFNGTAGVVTFDTRGHGRSGGLSTLGDKEINDLDVAVRYARELGYQRVATVGFSMGGSVVLRHAALCGGVDAVTSVSGPGRWFYRGTVAMRRVHLAAERRLGRTFSKYVLNTRISPDGWRLRVSSPKTVGRSRQAQGWIAFRRKSMPDSPR